MLDIFAGTFCGVYIFRVKLQHASGCVLFSQVLNST